MFSNRYLLGGIAGELLLAAVFVYAPPLQSLLGTAALPLRDLAFLVPYPFIVWGSRRGPAIPAFVVAPRDPQRPATG